MPRMMMLVTTDPDWIVKIRPVQPSPQQTIVCYSGGPKPISTAIARVWDGDDHLRCSLCDICSLRVNPPGEGETAVCLVSVTGKVDQADAPLFESFDASPQDQRSGRH